MPHYNLMNGYTDIFQKSQRYRKLTIKELMNRYKTVEKIKRGGQKTVYKATTSNGTVTALKIVNTETDQRILQEIEIVRNLNNEHVPIIYETGTVFDEAVAENAFYIVEEFVEGQSLRDYLDEGKRFSLTEAFSLAYALLDIEVHLEKKSILHRDINPSNIILGKNNNIYLIDFGIAKNLNGASLTLASATHGPFTPGYAPYEQFANLRNTQDVRTDLFRIGVTIYEACTGKNPFKEANDNWLQAIIHTQTIMQKPLVMSGDNVGFFSQFIDMLMAKNQSQRPENAETAMRYLMSIKSTLNLEERGDT